MTDPSRVVIIGAGFGGLWGARRLRGTSTEVTLIDRNNFHTFYPLLYQVGAAELEPVEIAEPVRGILRRQENARFLMAEALDVDTAARTVRTNRGTVPYDHLVVATGSVSHFLGIEGAAEHAFPLRSMEEGLAQRNHILSRFEKAVQLEDAEARRRALRFVIVGGGATGVEFAGALAELLRGPLAKDFPALADDVSLILLEAMDRVLPEMDEKLGRYAVDRLRRMGVDVRLDAPVERVTPSAVHLAGGEEIPTETVSWTAGVRGNPAAAHWGLPVARGGRITVRPSLQAEGFEDVWVVGDLAYVEEEGEPLPMIAPVAIQEGEHAADNILLHLRGETPLPFRYRHRGMLATIGRNKGVADVFGHRFTGFLAWFFWLAIHIVQLIGFRNRVVVLVNWAWDYFFFERAGRLIMPRREAARSEAGDAAAETDTAEAIGTEALEEAAGGDREAAATGPGLATGSQERG